MQIHAGRFLLLPEQKLALVSRAGDQIVLTLTPSAAGKIYRKLYPPRPTRCPACGRTFPREQSSGQAKKYCNDLCRGAWNREQRKKKRTRPGR